MFSKSLLTLLPIAFSQDSEFDAFSESALRKFSHINKMLMTQINTQLSSSEISKRIQNYGCHCFPGNSRAAGGKGPAVDEIDRLCAQLARCHKCIEFDHGNFVDGSWDADIGKYRWSEETDGSLSCDGNDEDHKRDLCECDRFYAVEMGKVWDDLSYNMTYWNAKNNAEFDFDYANVCVQQYGPGSSDDCCGDYPERYPYDSNTKMCCDEAGKAYDDSMYECCMDGRIVIAGTC